MVRVAGVVAGISIVPNTELRLLSNDKDVLQLFAGNPFPQQPPQQIRALLWQYWFTSMEEKRTTGMWWRRRIARAVRANTGEDAEGQIQVVQWPNSESHE